MRYSGINVLLVGENFHATAQSLKDPLHRWGFRCHLARTVRATFEFLKARGSDLVLSQMHLPDGSGFNLLSTLVGLPVTAFLCVPVEDSCLWLRAIDAGRNCWGEEMLRPAGFARALEEFAQRRSVGTQVKASLAHAHAA
jgi:response regulator RpfG family c-di-GMP phosphodiesterase